MSHLPWCLHIAVPSSLCVMLGLLPALPMTRPAGNTFLLLGQIECNVRGGSSGHSPLLPREDAQAYWLMGSWGHVQPNLQLDHSGL